MAYRHPVRHKAIAGALMALAAILFITGCGTPPVPPETLRADALDADLRGADAETFAPREYKNFQLVLFSARALYNEQKGRLMLFRNYDNAVVRFREAIAIGETAVCVARERKGRDLLMARASMESAREKIDAMKRVAATLNEGRYARGKIIRAEIAYAEGLMMMGRFRYADAVRAFNRGVELADNARSNLAPIISRFTDAGQLRQWASHVSATVRESEASGDYAIVVSKADRKLYLYRAGHVVRTFDIGIGYNGNSDKTHSGDRATPEGRYRVTRKNPGSAYYKALLINYPNTEDRRRYAALKRQGLVPAGAGIGGLIEIHGGGTDGMTYGCIAMDNGEIDALYSLIAVGTPVTIVGATGEDNRITSVLKGI